MPGLFTVLSRAVLGFENQGKENFWTMELDVVAEDVLSQDNQPTPQVLSKYRLAGHFCSVAIRNVLARCVAGVNCSELCQIGDDAILEQVQL
jgi:hypothetical protein